MSEMAQTTEDKCGWCGGEIDDNIRCGYCGAGMCWECNDGPVGCWCRDGKPLEREVIKVRMCIPHHVAVCV